MKPTKTTGRAAEAARSDAGNDRGGTIDEAALLRQARQVKSRAYAPYSHFRVGAVVQTAAGDCFAGVNVENASFRVTTCAEQSALAAMVCAGVTADVVAVAVVGDGTDPCTPCGACRQMIFEFGPNAMLYASGDGGRPLIASIGELLPHSFNAKRLGQGHAGNDQLDDEYGSRP